MKRKNILLAISGIILSAGLWYGCSAVKDVTDALANIKRLEFKIQNVANVNAAGVRLSDKAKIGDFSVSDGLKLANAYRTKNLPLDFVVNVAARNPNDGSGETKSVNAVISNIDWVLYLDNVKTISGVVGDDITVPGKGGSVNIPVRANLNLYDFFSNRSYESLINLALAIGGVSGSSTKVKIEARPTINTAFGPIRYPGMITIVDTEWRSE